MQNYYFFCNFALTGSPKQPTKCKFFGSRASGLCLKLFEAEAPHRRQQKTNCYHTVKHKL